MKIGREIACTVTFVYRVDVLFEQVPGLDGIGRG
jgi:hypothetical protein